METNPDAPEKAVQLVEFEEGTNNPIFFPDRLQRTLKNVEHLPLIVYSIAGMARTGKSFMMNLFVCFLTHVEKVSYFLLFTFPVHSIIAVDKFIYGLSSCLMDEKNRRCFIGGE